MVINELYKKQVGKNHEIYLHCNKCNCTFKWTPYTIDRYKGDVGRLSIAGIEYTSAPLCKGCRSLVEVFFAIRDLKESIETTDEAQN